MSPPDDNKAVRARSPVAKLRKMRRNESKGIEETSHHERLITSPQRLCYPQPAQRVATSCRFVGLFIIAGLEACAPETKGLQEVPERCPHRVRAHIGGIGNAARH